MFKTLLLVIHVSYGNYNIYENVTYYVVLQYPNKYQ